ncbi:hypothetical protein CEXT_220091 [Caerostris extrusa]|uniref:Uncharacterized protein n=1 Tax=Caerostris extrusa TaxID=172846 RepID=A0AAV4NE14_CAEEX|nr:hypothetical protein CEXT_220091 [Caerostris extrusa]
MSLFLKLLVSEERTRPTETGNLIVTSSTANPESSLEQILQRAVRELAGKNGRTKSKIVYTRKLNNQKPLTRGTRHESSRVELFGNSALHRERERKPRRFVTINMSLAQTDPPRPMVSRSHSAGLRSCRGDSRARHGHAGRVHVPMRRGWSFSRGTDAIKLLDNTPDS